MPNTKFVVLINPKSGGNVGSELLSKFHGILDGTKIYNLQEGGPKKALEDHCMNNQDLESDRDGSFRMIVCGGDGSIGWALSVMDMMNIPLERRPAIGIIPLGTGNDLSRALGWGGKYINKPLKTVLDEMEHATVQNMDRWSIEAKIDTSIKQVKLAVDRGSNEPIQAESKLPLNVVNNYFSVGFDALVALQFHKARNSNPEKFTSRYKNMVFQGLKGGRGILTGACSSLMDYMTVTCDGVDFTKRLKKTKCTCVLFLNIKSYAGGTRPWRKGDRSYQKPAMDDGMIEVIGLDNMDQALLQVGGSGINICQCKSVELRTIRAYPMQIDGEPFLMKPCTIRIENNSTKAPIAKLLRKDNNKTQFYRDKELEEWAATTIQRSFRNSRKSRPLSREKQK